MVLLPLKSEEVGQKEDNKHRLINYTFAGSPLTTTLAQTVATQAVHTTEKHLTTVATHAVQTTKAPLTTQTSTVPPTTTSSDPVNHDCNKFSVVSDLSHGQPVANGHAPNCSSGSYASTEAFVLNNCNVTTPDLWHPGMQVMSNCNAIPAYTAVGTYLEGIYAVGTGLSGVFLECIPNGFKIAFQVACDKSPEIRHIEQGGLGFLDPNTYYIIV
ncbi:uncharacterized protein LOC128240493 [Mya arenaria]|uniref:uncharacterized protein LOC128240493 n=1 Tax=Mya arenaria TaxID=6604 RepID=UPI0022E5227B|nr:uncharacterized protein LOC128240493 [Mya arenaria]